MGKRGAGLAELPKRPRALEDKAEADREQRVLGVVKRRTLAGLRPAEREPPGRLHRAEQYVGDPCPFAPWEPCGNEGVGDVQFAVDPQGAPGQESCQGRNAARAVGLEEVQSLLVAEREVLPVTGEFGIGLLTEPDDSDVRLAGSAAGRGEHRRAARRFGCCGNAAVDRGRTGEIGRGEIAAPLPCDRPAASLPGDVVGRASRHLDPRSRLWWEHAGILEDHLRIRHRLAGERAVFGRAEQLPLAAIGTQRRLHLAIENPQIRLQAQHPQHRCIEAAHRDRAVLHLAHEIGVERLPVLGHLVDIKTRHQRLRAIRIGAALDLPAAVPVADHQPLKTEIAAQLACEQRLIAVHLGAVDRVEARHHARSACFDCGRIGRGVDRHQLLEVAVDVALVDALRGAAVAEEVLGGSRDLALAEETRLARAAL